MSVFFFLSTVGVLVVMLVVATGVAVVAKWGPDWLVEALQATRILPSPQKEEDSHQNTADGELIRWIAHQAERIHRKGGGR